MITEKSGQDEIRDLQRLLISVGLMEFRASSRNGRWDDKTQEAVMLAYTRLGWDHDEDAKWISAPALAAVAATIVGVRGVFVLSGVVAVMAAASTALLLRGTEEAVPVEA